MSDPSPFLGMMADGTGSPTLLTAFGRRTVPAAPAGQETAAQWFAQFTRAAEPTAPADGEGAA